MSTTENRLGLRSVFLDNADTWTLAVGTRRKAERKKAAGWFYGVPTIVAGPFIWAHLHLQGVAQLLAGVTVFTALLFGLLTLVFNTGLSLKKDAAALGNVHNVRITIADLRANITYTALWAIILAGVLVVAAALSEPGKVLGWAWTPVLVWLFVHIGLNLLLILRRFRTAFNYVTR